MNILYSIMLKISVITNTFRIHDNPFLNSDIYIILVDSENYGENQLNFLNNILELHLLDLKKKDIEPLILTSYDEVNNILNDIKEQYKLYLDYINPVLASELPFKKYKYQPTWCMIDWTDKVDMIEKWFLPEALSNHKVFKDYVHKNIRKLFKNSKRDRKNLVFDSTYKYELKETAVPLPKKNLDSWIKKELKRRSFMINDKWYKPDTSPSTSITNDSEYLIDLHKTSKLSPFIALGVISPLVMYNYYIGETKMGSSRDQLLFREMFHASAQMKSFWDDDFGAKYNWKSPNDIDCVENWNNYINGTTGIKDLDWAMNQLKNEGWIHHLARHMVADYLTRGKLDIHWKYGMEWFKNTLVDHDKCVNRGNWMWLSGTAYSSKQRGYFHYGEKYITNKDKK